MSVRKARALRLPLLSALVGLCLIATPTVAQRPPLGQPDADGDWVIDAIDQCPGSIAGQTIGDDGCPVPMDQGDWIVLMTFAPASAELSADVRRILDEGAEILARYPELRIELAGHADQREPVEPGTDLSLIRARAAYRYLLARGMNAAHVVGLRGYGTARPLRQPAPNDTDDERADNRRIEINVQN